ncbi:GGDEF domain-containing protein [Catenulispora sp. NF23]|uniref:GGDEF domain-containing protein n=1 Tax=Catenulispora pinistramenti TaxID=2705254 RepID=A0ABS5KI66_9ACTN|nr:GGDEF domain-containing protein [Catenulispora pinistramenti]MBS2535224.1 GGDEF domain-containing protein [Catenulispora pinistramenti]MBS2546072.1 GGDEF domain-containing protein [Catenulispora pinistramenti]
MRALDTRRLPGARIHGVPPGYAAVGLLITAHASVALIGPAGAVPAVMGDAGLAVAAGLAAAACIHRTILMVRFYRMACFRCYSWLLAGLSCLAAAVGNAVWAWYELVLDVTPPTPSAADWSFLFFGPLALAAFVTAHGEQVSLSVRVRLLLDTTLVAGSLFVVAWVLALALAIERVDSPVRTFLVLGYPAFDLVLVSLLLALRVRTPGERGGIGTGVRVGYLMIVVCDSIFTMPAVREGYRSGGILDTGWFAGYLMIAVAAWYGDGWRPERVGQSAEGAADTTACGAGCSVGLHDCDAATGREVALALAAPDVPAADPLSPGTRFIDSPTRWAALLRTLRGILPYLAAAFCLAGVLADGLDTERRMDPVVLIAGAAVLVALVARQALTLFENQRLTEDLRRAAATLQHHAYHDALTGLANRALLTDRLEHALTQRHAEWEPVAVIFLDLDGFKGVNDSVGHETGDRVLVEAAYRISGSLRVGDTVARFGGDEFVIVLEVGTTVAGALVVAERIRGRLCAEYCIEGLAHRLGASIGVAFSEPGGTASNLLRRADAAMYRAKTAGRNRVVAEPLAATWAISHGETPAINA